MIELLPISILIPTMNRPNTLRQTLRSISAGSRLPRQIVIVDQSTSDRDQRQNRQALYELPDIIEKIFICQEFPSSTLARNNAMKHASYEILIFSDDDVYLYPDTLKNIAEIMTNPEIAMIAGIDDNAPPSRTNLGYFMNTKSYFYRKIGHVTLSMLGRYPDKIEEQTPTQWAMGFFFIVRKSLCDTYGLKWDETLASYAYAEDLDFSFSYYKKTRQTGMQCILSPQVRVKHMVSKEYRIPSYKHTWMYVVHRRYLSYKHNFGWISRAAMNWCDFWRFIERIIKRQNALDLLKAYIYYVKHKTSIKQGKL